MEEAPAPFFNPRWESNERQYTTFDDSAGEPESHGIENNDDTAALEDKEFGSNTAQQGNEEAHIHDYILDEEFDQEVHDDYYDRHDGGWFP